jgi:phosphate butyryltransferase
MLDFDTLFAQADARRPQVTVEAAGAADRTVLEALAEAHRRGWVRPILVASEPAIRQTAAECGIDLAPFTIVDADQTRGNIGDAAVAEVRAGRAQVLMKGQIDTPALMKAVLNSSAGLRTGRTLGQIVLMEVRRSDVLRTFLLTDTGITIAPTLDQKVDLLKSLIETSRALGSDVPRVALMSATEKVTESMPDTLDWAELQRRAEAGEFGEARVQGPLSFDLAFASDAGEKKRIAGGVVGDAEAMLFPNLLSANLTVKAIMYTAHCRFGGVVAGAACPIVFMSRADTTATRLNSLALAMRMVQ